MNGYRTDDLAPLAPEDLRAHFENSRELIFVVDAPSLRIIDANLAAANRLGLSRQELLRMEFPQLAPQLPREALSADQPQGADQPPPLSAELLGSGGTPCPVEISITWTETAGHRRGMIIAREVAGREDGETALSESDKRYRLLFTEMASGFALHEVICDGDGRACDFRYLAVNPAFERLTGVHAKDVIGKTLLEALPETDPSWIEGLGKVASTGESLRRENFHTSLGRYYDVVAFRPGPGQVAVTFSDITERKRTEKALRENEALFRAVIENMPASFFMKDLQGRYLYANQVHLDTHGKTAEEVIGKTARDFAPANIAEVYAELDRQVIESGQIQQKEFELDYPDGQKRVILGVKFPLFDDAGKVSGVAGYGVDITDRKAAERALEESEHRYRGLIEWSPLPIVVHADHRAIFINSRAVSMFGGQSPSDFAGRSILDFVDPEAREHTKNRSADFYEGRIDFSVEEFPLRRLDGTSFTAEVASRTIEFEGQTAVQIILNDITARKAAEQAARVLQEELAHVSRVSVMGEMAAGFAHELNQPLAAISNYAIGALRRLRSNGMTQTDVEKVLELVTDQARRAGEIIRRIRRFLTKEAQPLHPIDLNEAIRETAGLLKGEALNHQVTIELQLQEDLPPAAGDVIQIQQLILNLARNGIEAMGESDLEPKDLVIATSSGEQGELRITVSDTGPGLDMNKADQVFDPFFTTKTDGMGMGLSICRSIVQAHHGTLSVLPHPPHGATFECTLPAASQPPA